MSSEEVVTMSQTNNQTQKVSILVDYDSISNDPRETITKIIEKAREIGKVVKVRVYFLQDEFSQNKEVIDSILSMGVEPVVVMLAKDVKMAIDLLDDSYSEDIDVIVLSYRKEALLPALIDAKNRKQIVLVEFDDLPEGLKNIGDSFIRI